MRTLGKAFCKAAIASCTLPISVVVSVSPNCHCPLENKFFNMFAPLIAARFTLLDFCSAVSFPACWFVLVDVRDFVLLLLLSFSLMFAAALSNNCVNLSINPLFSASNNALSTSSTVMFSAISFWISATCLRKSLITFAASFCLPFIFFISSTSTASNILSKASFDTADHKANILILTPWCHPILAKSCITWPYNGIVSSADNSFNRVCACACLPSFVFPAMPFNSCSNSISRLSPIIVAVVCNITSCKVTANSLFAILFALLAIFCNALTSILYPNILSLSNIELNPSSVLTPNSLCISTAASTE